MANEQTIANLIVKLSAQTVELSSGLKNAEGMLSSFRDTAQKVLGGLSLAVVGAKFASAISGAREFAAEMSRMSEKVGVPIEQISAMADAAEKSGVGIQSLGIGLKFLSRNLLEASRGGGDLRGIMEELGVSFESSPGVIRPTTDILLDLSEKFSQMEDGAAKTAIALKFFGRSGQEMVPFLNLGRAAITEFMGDAQKFGTVIDSDTGQKARLFGRTIKEIGDAIKGLAIGIMSALLPSMQAGANSTLEMATHVNSLRGRLTEIGETLRYVAAAALPLLAVQIASAVVGFANLGWAIRNVGFIIQYFAVTTLGPMLMNPLTWIAVALAGLAVLWTHLGAGTREAARAHEEFAASVRMMKLDDLKESLRDTELQMTLLIQKYQAMITELEQGPSFNPFADMLKGKEASEAKQKIDELRERIKILQAAIGAVNKEKIQPPVLTSDEALKKLESKLSQLRAEIISLGDPVAGAKAALEAFISETMRGIPETPKLSRAIRELRLEFSLLTALQQIRANVEAKEKGTVSVAAARADAETAALKRNYDQGLVDLHTYYSERRRVVSEQAELEIETLGKALSRAKTPAEATTIQAEIDVKTTTKGKVIAEEVKAESDAFKELFKTMASGDLAQFVASNDLYMMQLQASYDDGLIEAKTFFSERRRIIEENARMEIGNIETQIPGMDPIAAQEAANKIMAITQKLNTDLSVLNRDAVLADRAMQLQRLESASMVASGMGNIFTQLYEMGGKKMKVFYYLQKAMAIAQIYLQAAIAAMAALAPPPIGLGPVAGTGLAAMVWGMAAANIAIVMAQTLKGMWKGGPVTGGSGARDDVPAMLTRGEYVHTKKSVEFYGLPIMEAIRRMAIPKDRLRGFGYFPVATPQLAFAGGGMVTGGGGTTNQVNVGPITVGDGNKRLAGTLREEIEATVVRVLKEYSRQ
jgi:hypothetical protein